MDGYELYFEHSVKLVEEYSNSPEISHKEKQEERGVSITAIKGGGMSNYYIGSWNQKEIEKGIRIAFENALLANSNDKYDFAEERKCSNYVRNMPKELFDYIKIKEDFKDRNLGVLNRVIVNYFYSDVKIKNTKGFNNGYNSGLLVANYEVGETNTWGRAIGHNVQELYADMLNDTWIKYKSKKYPIQYNIVNQSCQCILLQKSFSVIFSALMRIFIGRLENEHIYIVEQLKEYAGELEIIDDGTTKKGFATAPFDCEGRITKKKNLIVKNKLTNFLWDAYDEPIHMVVSSGNKLKNSYREKSYIGFTNIIIEGDKRQVCDVFDEGYLIDNVAYLPDSIDWNTGSFHFPVSGYFIKDDNIQYKIPRFTIKGTIVDLFRKAQLLVSDEKWTISGTAIKTSAILVRDLGVSL